MNNAQCIMHNSQYTIHNEQCTMHNAQYTIYNAPCTMHNLQCTMHNAQWNLATPQCSMHTPNSRSPVSPYEDHLQSHPEAESLQPQVSTVTIRILNLSLTLLTSTPLSCSPAPCRPAQRHSDHSPARILVAGGTLERERPSPKGLSIPPFGE